MQVDDTFSLPSKICSHIQSSLNQELEDAGNAQRPLSNSEAFQLQRAMLEAHGWAFVAQIAFTCDGSFVPQEQRLPPKLPADVRETVYHHLQQAAGPSIHPTQEGIARELLWRLLLVKATSTGFEGQCHERVACFVEASLLSRWLENNDKDVRYGIRQIGTSSEYACCS